MKACPIAVAGLIQRSSQREAAFHRADGHCCMKRKLLITGRNAGLFSLFLQVIDNCMTAEQQGLLAWVEFGREVAAFWNGDNVWETFFEQPMLTTKPEHFDLSSSSFGGHRGGYGEQQLFYRCEHITPDMRQRYHAAVRAYGRLRPFIREKADAFLASLPTEYVAIHIRGTDRRRDSIMRPLSDYVNRLEAHADMPIVVCADSHEAVEAVSRNYRDVYAYDAVRCDRYESTDPVHAPGLHDPYRIAEDVIIEMLIMSQARLLIHSGSNVSLTAWLWNDSLQHDLLTLERRW